MHLFMNIYHFIQSGFLIGRWKNEKNKRICTEN